MTKSKSSASSIVVPVLAIHLINGAQFLNATRVRLLRAAVTISPLSKT